MTKKWQPDKKPYQNMQMEDMKAKTEYAFSINPDKQYKHNNVFIHKYIAAFHYRVIDHLEDFNDIVKIRVFPEFSSTGRFHFHGYITIKKVLRFYAEVIPRLMDFGTFEIAEQKEGIYL